MLHIHTHTYYIQWTRIYIATGLSVCLAGWLACLNSWILVGWNNRIFFLFEILSQIVLSTSSFFFHLKKKFCHCHHDDDDELKMKSRLNEKKKKFILVIKTKQKKNFLQEKKTEHFYNTKIFFPENILFENFSFQTNICLFCSSKKDILIFFVAQIFALITTTATTITTPPFAWICTFFAHSHIFFCFPYTKSNNNNNNLSFSIQFFFCCCCCYSFTDKKIMSDYTRITASAAAAVYNKFILLHNHRSWCYTYQKNNDDNFREKEREFFFG